MKEKFELKTLVKKASYIGYEAMHLGDNVFIAS